MGSTVFKRFNQGVSPTGDIPASQVKFTDNEDAQTKVTQLESKQGDLSELETESKDNLVEAINEVKNDIPDISTDIESDKTSDDKTASPKAVFDLLGTPTGGYILLCSGAELYSCGGTIRDSDKKWIKNDIYYGALFYITHYAGKKIKITKNSNGNNVVYAFVSAAPVWNQPVSFATGYNTVVSSDIDVIDVTVPADAVYLYLYLQSEATVFRPSAVYVWDENINRAIVLDKVYHRPISVMTYNIGHFSMGVSPSSAITAADYESKVSQFRELMSSNDTALYAIQEYSSIFGENTSGEDVNTKDELFGQCDTQYESEQLHYTCYALFGKGLPIYNVKINDFECLADEEITHTSLIDAQDYRYISADLYAFGKEIKLIATHLAFDNNRPGVLQDKQIAELVTVCSVYPYVIMMADWNIVSTNELDAFVDAGYAIANVSTPTYPSDNRVLDNIIVKGLKIANTRVIPSSLSDHYPVVCDIIDAE